jgi:hypothetical protein
MRQRLHLLHGRTIQLTSYSLEETRPMQKYKGILQLGLHTSTVFSNCFVLTLHASLASMLFIADTTSIIVAMLIILII